VAVDARNVRIGGKSWGRSFQHILSTVVGGLGCTGMDISAEFYKLLIYQEGGFFLPHRDTEKTHGMFGTLTIVLPSLHCGGFSLAISAFPYPLRIFQLTPICGKDVIPTVGVP
jgi:hypothetical protein